MHRRRMGTMASLLKGGKSFQNYVPCRASPDNAMTAPPAERRRGALPPSSTQPRGPIAADHLTIICSRRGPLETNDMGVSMSCSILSIYLRAGAGRF